MLQMAENFIDALYVYTYTPGAQIKLFFNLRQVVFAIEPIFIYATLTWPWKVKCDFDSNGAQIKLLFTLRQAVFEIEPIFIYATC